MKPKRVRKIFAATLLLAQSLFADSLFVGPLYVENNGQVAAVVDYQSNSAPPVTLDKSKIWLIEDGFPTVAASDLQTFQHTGKGLALVLATDVSGSMRGALLNEIKSALASVNGWIAAPDRLELLSFASDARVESPFGSPGEAFDKAVQRLALRGKSTVLYDAVDAAVKQLETYSGPSRRRVLVLSDGRDEGSRSAMRDVIAQNKKIPVDVIACGNVNTDSATAMESLTAGTGGSYSFAHPGTVAQLLKNRIQTLENTSVAFFNRSLDPSGTKTKTVNVEARLPSLVLQGLPAFQLAIPKTAPAGGDTMIWAILVGIVLALVGLGVYILRRRKRQTDEPPQPIDEPAAPPPVGSLAGHSPRKRRTIVDEDLGQVAAPAGASRLTLDLVAGGASRRTIEVTKTPFRVGADPSNDLVLDGDEFASAYHALIRLDHGRFLVTDSNSRNGTFVNGTKVGAALALVPGDLIRFGGTEFKVLLSLVEREKPLRRESPLR